MSAKDNLRNIAEKVNANLPPEMSRLYDDIVKEMKNKSVAGFFGCSFTINMPSEYSDYLPHIIGDLRGGGLSVDVVSVTPEKRQTIACLIITW